MQALREKQLVSSVAKAGETPLIVTLPLAVSEAARVTQPSSSSASSSSPAGKADQLGGKASELVTSERQQQHHDVEQETNENEDDDDEEDEEDAQDRQRKKAALMAKLDRAIRTFNINAKKGIRFIVEQGMVDDSPADVADFLLNTPGLNKAHIGEFLGEPKDFNLAVLSSVANTVIDVREIKKKLPSFMLSSKRESFPSVLSCLTPPETKKSFMHDPPSQRIKTFASLRRSGRSWPDSGCRARRKRLTALWRLSPTRSSLPIPRTTTRQQKKHPQQQKQSKMEAVEISIAVSVLATVAPAASTSTAATTCLRARRRRTSCPSV